MVTTDSREDRCIPILILCSTNPSLGSIDGRSSTLHTHGADIPRSSLIHAGAKEREFHMVVSSGSRTCEAGVNSQQKRSIDEDDNTENTLSGGISLHFDLLGGWSVLLLVLSAPLIGVRLCRSVVAIICLNKF